MGQWSGHPAGRGKVRLESLSQGQHHTKWNNRDQEPAPLHGPVLLHGRRPADKYPGSSPLLGWPQGSTQLHRARLPHLGLGAQVIPVSLWGSPAGPSSCGTLVPSLQGAVSSGRICSNTKQLFQPKGTLYQSSGCRPLGFGLAGGRQVWVTVPVGESWGLSMPCSPTPHSVVFGPQSPARKLPG